MRTLGSRRGQGMVEYIIIVVVIAIAALAIFGVFGDRIRGILGAATEEIGGDSSKVGAALEKTGVETFKELDKEVGGGGQ